MQEARYRLVREMVDKREDEAVNDRDRKARSALGQSQKNTGRQRNEKGRHIE
jgi:hypothetical protein